MSAAETEDFVIDERRTQVASMRSQGFSEREIAKELNVSKTTIHNDLLEIRAERKLQRLEDMDRHIDETLDRFAEAHRESWAAFKRSVGKMRKKTTVCKVVDGKEVEETTTVEWMEAGDSTFIDKIQKGIIECAKILDVYPAVKTKSEIDLTTHTEHELDEAIKRLGPLTAEEQANPFLNGNDRFGTDETDIHAGNDVSDSSASG
jgi:predicted transcriptional regulator